ncbi:MAG TPA: hypothetical protein VII63_09780 [Caulobacteraceae bacterium]
MTLRLLPLVLLLAVGVPAACSAAPANPLIGDWRVEPGGDVNSDGFAYCKVTPRLTFTPTTETMYAESGAHGTNQVIYLVSGRDIYVSSSPGFVGAPKFTMLGPNEMTLDAVGHCKYRR